jgi:hypothetical protein
VLLRVSTARYRGDDDPTGWPTALPGNAARHRALRIDANAIRAPVYSLNFITSIRTGGRLLPRPCRLTTRLNFLLLALSR